MIDISELTEGTNSVEGTGVFDVLMRSVNANLQKEYQAGRITGAKYADVYLSVMNATLQQAIAYPLSVEQTRLTKIQADVAEEKGGFR